MNPRTEPANPSSPPSTTPTTDGATDNLWGAKGAVRRAVCEDPACSEKEVGVADATELLGDEMIDPVTGEIIDQKDLAERLLAQAKEQGVSLIGPGGLLNQLTKNVLETALNARRPHGILR